MIEEIDLYDYPTYCQSCYLTVKEDYRTEWNWKLFILSDGLRLCSSCMRVLRKELNEWSEGNE